MSTLKANKDKARFISNPISQDALDGDWVDHEVITKYKLPEIVVDASTTESLLVSPTEITTGDKLKVLDGASMVERTAGTVTTTGGSNDGADNASTTDSVPAMTTATAPSGVVSASSFHALHPPYWSFDDTVNAGWLSNGVSTGWIQYQSTTSRIINKFTMVANSNSGDADGSSRHPKNFELLGSNNGTDWTELHAVTGKTDWVATSGTVHTFTFINATSYTYHRINISLNMGDAYCGIGEIQFIENATAAKYQAPITATDNIPTKAFFNKTIDTTLSAEATGKCKSSTITQIGVL